MKYHKRLSYGFGFFIATIFIIWSIFAFFNMFWNFGINWFGFIWLGLGLVIMFILIWDIMKRHNINIKLSNLVLEELRYNPNATPEQIATTTGIPLLDVKTIIPTSNNDISQFRNLLLKMGKDRRNIVQNSSELRRKMGEGEVIVLKGDPRYMALFLIIIVNTAIAISTIFSFDVQTVIILLASTLTIGLVAFFSARNKMLILHPEGFLFRKNIFFIFCQKWSNLASQPQLSIDSGSNGEKWYNLIFTGTWRTKRVDISSLKIKDIKGKKLKLQFLWEITTQFFETSYNF
ncbi:MAG: hypothetical protein ACFFBH_10770 [Promethearchaeota archaeon]